jgi:hypothetical protein
LAEVFSAGQSEESLNKGGKRVTRHTFRAKHLLENGYDVRNPREPLGQKKRRDEGKIRGHPFEGRFGDTLLVNDV